MRLAITQRVVENESYPERRDCLSQEWPEFVSNAIPTSILLPVPNQLEGAAAWAEEANIDGLILSGGNDWGDAPERDRTEAALFAYCRAAGLPILGTCRGIQAVNLLLGGSIEGDLQQHTAIRHVARCHRIHLHLGVFEALAGGDELTVNSYHNQGIVAEGVAESCFVFATADDDIVEGICHRNEPVLALQWHPERTGSVLAFDTAVIERLFAEGAFWL